MTNQIHRRWFGPRGERPPLVLLHEGLGSVSTWGRFPEQLAEATGRAVLAYDRPGYGHSGPRPGPWPAGFLQADARALATVVASEGIDEAILVGHSDGATIALLYPSQVDARAPKVAGIVSLSAHALVEPVTVDAIRALRRTYADQLRPRLARHHHDADALFEAWSEVWVSDRFRSFTIDTELAGVHCPVLALQGARDSYGTRAQLERIEARLAGPVEVHELAGTDHWPHREATETVLNLIGAFCARY